MSFFWQQTGKKKKNRKGRNRCPTLLKNSDILNGWQYFIKRRRENKGKYMY
jgi:hypothetical protein